MFSGPSFLFQFLVSFTVQNVPPSSPRFPKHLFSRTPFVKTAFSLPECAIPVDARKGKKGLERLQCVLEGGNPRGGMCCVGDPVLGHCMVYQASFSQKIVGRRTSEAVR